MRNWDFGITIRRLEACFSLKKKVVREIHIRCGYTVIFEYIGAIENEQMFQAIRAIN